MSRKDGHISEVKLQLPLYTLSRSLCEGWDGLSYNTATFSPWFCWLGSATRNALGPLHQGFQRSPWFSNVTVVPGLGSPGGSLWTSQGCLNLQQEETKNTFMSHPHQLLLEYDLNYFDLFSSVVHRPETYNSSSNSPNYIIETSVSSWKPLARSKLLINLCMNTHSPLNWDFCFKIGICLEVKIATLHTTCNFMFFANCHYAYSWKSEGFQFRSSFFFLSSSLVFQLCSKPGSIFQRKVAKGSFIFSFFLFC